MSLNQPVQLSLEPQVIQDQQDSQDQMDLKAVWDHPENQDSQDQPDEKDHQDHQDKWVNEDETVVNRSLADSLRMERTLACTLDKELQLKLCLAHHEETLACQDQQDHQDHMDPLEHQDLKEELDHKDPWDCLANQDCQELQESMD